MIKSALKFAIGAALLAATASVPVFATTKALTVSAVIQELAGPSPRCASQFGGTITGSGNSAMLGRVVIIATDCITPQPPLYNFSQGKMIIVTTSGDQIFANYSGQFVPTGDGAKFVFSGATFQITGGSGRYILASGGGTLSGGEDMSNGSGTAELNGTINWLGW